MSIQSTIRITRDSAIKRVKDVYKAICARDYYSLGKMSFEDDRFEGARFVHKFVADFDVCAFDIKNVDKWTDGMLADVLDGPFFRWSKFDNYVVSEQFDE